MHTVTKNFHTPTVDWNSALECWDYCVRNHHEVRIGMPGYLVCHEANTIEMIKPVLQKLNCKDAHLYMNISLLGDTYGKHSDDRDVWYWQCQGQTRWSVDENEYVLDPGDLIYIEQGTPHEVVPLSVRLGISMSK